MPKGAVARVLAERPAGSRTIEALAATIPTAAAVDDLLDRLGNAAAAYAATAA
jgi:hypothetical protein